MRFDQWLLKHKNKPFALGFIAKEFIETRYDPLFKYHYCELFIRCYYYAQYEHQESCSRLDFDTWLYSQVGDLGKTGNLARDIIDCCVLTQDKYKYCKRYVRFFGTCLGQYLFNPFSDLKPLGIALNLDSAVSGVRRVSLHLIEGSCFKGFEIFPELKNYPAFKDCVFTNK